MISYNHLWIRFLIGSTFALGMTGCGGTTSHSESFDSSNGTGPSTGTGGTAASSGSATGGSGGGGTAGTGGSAGAGGSDGSSSAGEGGGTAGTGGGAGAGGSGGSGGGSGGGGGPAKPLYLVSIDHWASPSVLRKVDIETGIGTVVCELPSGPDGVDDVNYHSSTFSRDGILFATNANLGTIDKINPCDCTVKSVGPTGFGSVPGITSNQDTGLYGIEITEDILLGIDPMSGAATKLGDLGVDFTSSGATWSDALNGGQGGLYAINSADNGLYTINTIEPINPNDPPVGAATLVATISDVQFQSVGVEMHPANGVIYGCTNDMVLYSIDPLTGHATKIGPGMGHTQTCNNLAAPWGKVDCLDAL